MKPMHILSPFKAFRSLHKSSEQAYQEAPLDEQAFNVDEDEDTMDIRQAGEGFDRKANTKRYVNAEILLHQVSSKAFLIILF
jgi:hypothetical protein